MNTREAMRALLEGKKITHPNFDTGCYVHLDANGDLVNQNGDLRYLYRYSGYSVYEEANPHTPGTFAWAYEECARGKSVRRPGKSAYRYIGGSAHILAEDAVARDWEVV